MNLKEFVKTLENNGLIAERLHWEFSRAVFFMKK